MRAYLLWPALILTGASGLLYQLAWTRRLVTVTSATSSAQALILAIYMAGLGIGAAAGGLGAQRMKKPLLGYAMVELLAALLALGSLPVIAASERVRPSVGVFGQLGLVGAYLLVTTTLLGASLPLVLEAVLRADDEQRGRFAGMVYGLNTLGAAGGCLVAGFVAIEAVGLSGTTAVGAAVALLGVGLATLAGIDGRSPASRTLPIEPSTEANESAVHVEYLYLGGALFGGFVGLGAEVLWTRLLQLVIPGTVYAVTQVLFAVLLGIAVGSLLAAIAAQKLTKMDTPHESAKRLAGLIVALTAVLLAWVPLFIRSFADASSAQKAIAAGSDPLAFARVLVVLVPPSALIAMLLPLFLVASRAPRGSRVFGLLFAANTLGSVLGSLTVGFVLIPSLGTSGAGATLVFVALVLGAVLVLRDRSRLVMVALAGLAATALVLSVDLPREIYTPRLDDGEEILELREGIDTNVFVTQIAESQTRRLWINSVWVATDRGPHSAFGHIPALFVAEPRRGLGIALGTGQTFAAALAHGVEHLDCVEIDESVIALSRRWFGEANGGLLDDARVHVHHDDGRAFIRRASESYDLIILEPLQSWTAGTSALYSVEFYREARRVLEDDGVLGQWIPFYGQEPNETRAMVRSGLQVFKYASLWLTLRDGVVVYSDRPFALSFEVLAQRIRARGLSRLLYAFPAAHVPDLVSFLALGPEGIESWTKGAEVLRDDRPLLELRAASQIGRPAKFERTVLSMLPHLDPLEAYLVESSTSARADLLLAERLRRAFLDLQLMGDARPQDRLQRLESLLPDAIRSARWQSRHQRERRAASRVLLRGP